MKTRVLGEEGYSLAAFGFSLSYNSTMERAKLLFPAYAFKQGGENKFLESIVIWLDVTAPRFWWQEADTYRVGTTKQSESTMHTLKKTVISQENFEYPVPPMMLEIIADMVDNNAKIEEIKNVLPEGFLQRRIWMMNYKGLQNIYNQRKNHRLPQWKIFFDDMIPNLQHPEFIIRS